MDEGKKLFIFHGIERIFFGYFDDEKSAESFCDQFRKATSAIYMTGLSWEIRDLDDFSPMPWETTYGGAKYR